MNADNLRTLPRFFAGLSLIAAAGLFTACGDDTNDTPDASVNPDAGGGNPDAGGGGFEQPANTVALNFTIDDSANKTYTQGELRWKGSFQYDAATRIMTHDPSWAGGDSTKYPVLYDDGPWNMGGHEPAGSTAGDNIWGITTFFAKPDMATNFEYGAEDGNAGWIWIGPNGTFVVQPTSTSIDVPGLVIPAFGTIDLRLTIDTSTLAGGFDFMAGDDLTVKGSAWGWSEVDLTQTGTTAIYEFVLSENVGAGTPRVHSGLLASGGEAQFVFVIGGVEYKVGGTPPTTGVDAYLKIPPSTTWTPVAIQNKPDGDRNTYVAVP